MQPGDSNSPAPRTIKLETMRLGPRHLDGLKLLRWFQYTTRIENFITNLSTNRTLELRFSNCNVHLNRQRIFKKKNADSDSVILRQDPRSAIPSSFQGMVMLLVPEPHLEQLEVKVLRKRKAETSAKCPQWLNSTCLRAHIGPPGKKHRHWRGVWELSGCQLKGHSEWKGSWPRA